MFCFYDSKIKDLEMFLDLCDASNTVSAKTFLEIICELCADFDCVDMVSGESFRQFHRFHFSFTTYFHSIIFSGKVSNSYVECLQQIALKVSEKQYVLR